MRKLKKQELQRIVSRLTGASFLVKIKGHEVEDDEFPVSRILTETGNRRICDVGKTQYIFKIREESCRHLEIDDIVTIVFPGQHEMKMKITVIIYDRLKDYKRALT